MRINTAYIEVINYCNQKCVYCYNDAVIQKQLISESEFKCYVDELIKHDVKTITAIP